MADEGASVTAQGQEQSQQNIPETQSQADQSQTASFFTPGPNGTPVPAQQTNIEAMLSADALSAYDRLILELREWPYQPDLWARAIGVAESERDLTKIAATYDLCLEYYPDSAAVQIAYLRHYLSPELFSTAVAKFNQFLKTNAQSVELWRYYWDCFRKNPRKDPDIVKQIHHTYEIALNKVGWDKDSGEIWKSHIQFLKERSDWDENTRRDALRKVYHRAVQIPIDNVESLWQELEAFENGINRTIAKKHMSDLSPAHTQARSILRQMQNKYLPPLNLPQSLWNPPPPPTASSPSPTAPSLHLPVHPTFSQEDRTLIGNWKVYLKWEESNPLELEDKTALNNRILGIYKKALGRMRFYPEIWFLAFIWAKGVGKVDEAKRLLEEGLRANPKSCLLSYAQAEQLELKKDYPAVHALFQKLLSLLRDELNDLHNQLNPPSAPSSQELDPDESQMTVIVPPDNATQVVLEKEIKDRKAEYGSVWIMYIRFGRRSEGLASSRSIFKEARKEKWTPWTVYEACAMWEYRNADRPTQQSKLEIPINIFERGMNLFGTDPEFVKVYLVFLISVDDEKNARALFERTISTFTGDQAKPLWETWTHYEYQYGDLESALKLEQRLAEATAYPPIKRFAKRYTDSRGTDPIAERDLGWEKFKQSSRSSSGFLNGNSQSQLYNGVSASQQQSSSGNHNASSSQSLHGGKRGSSPEGHRGGKRDAGDRDHPGHGPNKRARGSSPSRERERERERERDRERDSRADRERPGWERRRSPPPPVRRYERDVHVPEEKVVALPQSLASFMAQMPGKESFDGPVFDTEDLLNLFRSAVIPASTIAARPRSPPPPARGTRPPPDYGPYQGPGGGGAGAAGKRWGY